MKPTFKDIHLQFRLNGIYFDREELKEVAYSYVKEGLPYEQSVGDFLIDWLNDMEYVTVKTSGSTGMPKRIRLKKEHMVNSALATGDFFGIEVGDKAIHCLPADYIAGKMMLVRALILGLKIDLIPPSSNPLKGIEKKYDFCAMIPLQLRNSLERLDSVKKLIVGGGAVSSDVLKALQTKKTKTFATYGMTETITHVAVKKLNRFISEETLETSHYNTLPNVTISKDERGCLVIEAPYLSEAPVYTNDLVELVSDTSFQLLGRFDNIINSGSVKLVPEVIEEKYHHVIDKRFFVAGEPDPTLGQRLVLIVEGSEDSTLLSNLKRLKTLDKFELPRHIYFVSAFAETETGKIQRTETLKQIH